MPSTPKPRRIIVTSGLIYANGSLHLGHILEIIQTDIWVRFQKCRGHECYYICGNDAHGTPIMLKAEQQGITAEDLITQMKVEHEADSHDFLIHFDYFHTTHSPENRELANTFYQRLRARGDIVSRTIKQAFDPEKNIFLPDRYVKGSCPRCNAADQYGDSCENCGATYSPTELVNPVSVISGATPIEKESEHFFFQLKSYENLLKDWIQDDHVQTQVRHKLNEWFDHGLRDWDISRDAPYFGFEIPDAPGKYFYVWLDAPIGYMASFQKYCEQNPELNFDDFWNVDSTTELYHFIGKDIIYFHALFWPAMLAGSQFRLPSGVYVHGFLTVDGKKMSKSRGTFINARDYLNVLDPEYLRYYFAAKLSHGIDDIDLNWDDFQARVNSDLVGKVVNIASRCAGFINKKFANVLAAQLPNPELHTELLDAAYTIAHAYEARDYAQAVRLIMGCADQVNQYIDHEKPWVLAKQQGEQAQVQAICTQGINGFRLLMIYLKPILPRMAAAAEEFLNCDPLTWADIQLALLDHRINVFKPLLQRVDDDAIDQFKAQD